MRKKLAISILFYLCLLCLGESNDVIGASKEGNSIQSDKAMFLLVCNWNYGDVGKIYCHPAFVINKNHLSYPTVEDKRNYSSPVNKYYVGWGTHCIGEMKLEKSNDYETYTLKNILVSLPGKYLSDKINYITTASTDSTYYGKKNIRNNASKAEYEKTKNIVKSFLENKGRLINPIDSLRVNSLEIITPDGEDSLLIGSFSYRNDLTKQTVFDNVFMVFDIKEDVIKPSFEFYNSCDDCFKNDIHWFSRANLLDVIDINRDGKVEVIYYVEGYESMELRILERNIKRWEQIFKVSPLGFLGYNQQLKTDCCSRS